MTRSIAECRAAGTIFEAHEAVAIAQQLIFSLRDSGPDDQVRPPYGPPSVDNVFLNDDGSVKCLSCMVTPAVSEVGKLLEQLLPPGSMRVPGGLRYAIARALLNVDVSPFDSLDDLSADLARHERGDRADIVRNVLLRSDGRRAIAAMPLVERRADRASTTSLRRELREADRRLYQQQLTVVRSEPAVIDLVAVQAPAPRGRSWNAAAACLAAGLSLIAAGELMHTRKASTPTPQPAPVVAQVAATDEPPLARPQSIPAPEGNVVAIRDISTKSTQTSGPAPRRIAVKRSTRPAASGIRRAVTPRPPKRGMLDRLRLRWLRNAFTPHSDL